jgi:hypothetical protein
MRGHTPMTGAAVLPTARQRGACDHHPSLHAQVVQALLQDAGFARTPVEADADVVLLNTCAIREKAEARIWGRLAQLQRLKAQRRAEGRCACFVWVGACAYPRACSPGSTMAGVHLPAIHHKSRTIPSVNLCRSWVSYRTVPHAPGLLACMPACMQAAPRGGRAGLHGGAPQDPVA